MNIPDKYKSDLLRPYRETVEVIVMHLLFNKITPVIFKKAPCNRYRYLNTEIIIKFFFMSG